MEQYIDSILTLILIGIYWYNTKSQNQKIKAQSDIINDLREHLKFFDLQKIKDYLELRETEKDKLLEITKQTIQKEFELKESTVQSASSNLNNNQPNYSVHDIQALTEVYTYIVNDLASRSDDDIEQILTSEFVTSRIFLQKMIINARTLLNDSY
jgi:predicted MPP superfamily phosphohydrolase